MPASTTRSITPSALSASPSRFSLETFTPDSEISAAREPSRSV